MESQERDPINTVNSSLTIVGAKIVPSTNGAGKSAHPRAKNKKNLNIGLKPFTKN